MKCYIKKLLKKLGWYNFFCRNFLSKREFIIEPFVYIDKNGNVSKDITDTIRWLEKFYIETQCIEFAEKEFWKYAEEKYSFHQYSWIF